MSKNRNWCFTLNNYTEVEVESIKKLEEKCTYLVFGYEVGENGTPHLQGYIEFANARALGGVKKLIGSRAHLEPRMGTSKQASDYCKKDEKFFECGELSNPGKRTDLLELKASVEEGNVDVIETHFELYCRYRGGINDLIDKQNLKKKRTEMTKGIWFHGPTGSGKSHRAFEMAGDDVYVWCDDGGWWDGYTGQETVVINDFRGGIKYNELLQLVDKWPHSVRRRGKVPMPFTSKTVIVTSSLPPEKVYRNVDAEDSIDQLLRRFEVIELAQRLKKKTVKFN